MTEKKTIWEAAGRPALILGLIPVAYMALSSLLGKIPGESGLVAGLVGVASMLLWAVKFGTCIYLVKVFLKAYSKAVPDAGHNEVFKFGAAVALLSALIYAAFYLAYVLFIQPDAFSAAMDILKESPMMDSNSLEAMERIMPKMPAISFFSQLIYCFIWGVVLSAIFSRNIPSDNPFAGEDQNFEQ